MEIPVPILWQFTYSHFNEKVRWALDFKRIRHQRRSLLPGLHLPKIKGMTGQTAVPVLILNGSIFFDSSRIIEVLETSHSTPPLIPLTRPSAHGPCSLKSSSMKNLVPMTADGFSMSHLTIPPTWRDCFHPTPRLQFGLPIEPRFPR
jgi:hypothetical protein